jgi:hypothetical protein
VAATSLLYQFLVGGVIFAVGIAVPWLSGDYSFRKPGDRRLLLSILAASLAYLILQTAWHLFAAGSG